MNRGTLIAAALLFTLSGVQSPEDTSRSFQGPLPGLTDAQRSVANGLKDDVVLFSTTIGERNIWTPANYRRAADEIESRFRSCGFKVTRQVFQAEGQPCVNVIAERAGTKQPDRVVVIGAHYDSVRGTTGANDNASGVAALLMVARNLKGFQPDKTLRLVAFANEEPPFFQTEAMGSLVYARECYLKNEKIVAMLSFDGLGFYTDAPGSQDYPPPFDQLYPHTGNFIAFAGNLSSAELVKRSLIAFRSHARFPSEGGVAPGAIPETGWSDHWSFWQVGYPAVMVTDTLPFRYAHYHTEDDTPDKLDFEGMARVVEGLTGVVRELTKADEAR